MSSVIIAGNTSGTITLDAPNVAGTTTLTLPTTSGTLALSGGAVSGTTGSFSGDLSFNSGYGSAAVAYGCRAWVNFNGTGTVAIRASGNVTSITDQGTGGYTVNFTTAMPDANYTSVASISPTVYANNNGGTVNIASTISGNNQNELTPTTSAIGMTINDRAGAAVDVKYISVAIFR